MNPKAKAFTGQDRLELDTPCLALDLDRLDANLRLMQEQVRARNRLCGRTRTH